ncbi:MAG TPA: thioredoxin domain-containing protein, partial [Nannocystaceae bacterium]|nr:thioredoxin domain-containing protein [Nannocystaceae bacterium]
MPNRLARSTSPYLRQHADNPVDWYEWGPEALARAIAEDKPILLSVGYSACHWCHVMAHESFEDDAVAAVMNERFVNIKVDREERPDIDAIYQKVVQLLGQGGGWPLTVFLTPQQQPFYGGTYFPPQSRHGRPGFVQVLLTLADLYAEDKTKIEMQVESFRDGLQSIAAIVDDERKSADKLPALDDTDALREAGKRLVARVDTTWGGFGREPKFPNATGLELLARLARGQDNLAREAGDALRLTLDKMYEGGIYDHLRGGFARYSVDRVWLVPHFEKMLYDNAQLVALYADASLRWPDVEHYRRVVIESIDYLVADMRAQNGLFYAATDADSEGEEGKYFCWTPAELAELLGDETLFASVYGVKEGGNFEHGWSILNLPRTLAQRAEEHGITIAELLARLAPARAKLLAHRYTRVPPLRDDKLLTSWNALLASGLCRAASAAEAWGDDERARAWLELATTIVQTLLREHVDGDGRVLRASFEGRAHTRGFLDDLAFLGRACLDVHEHTLDPQWLAHARTLAERGVAQHGHDRGFWFTAGDAESLIERDESPHDGP